MVSFARRGYVPQTVIGLSARHCNMAGPGNLVRYLPLVLRSVGRCDRCAQGGEKTSPVRSEKTVVRLDSRESKFPTISWEGQCSLSGKPHGVVLWTIAWA
jgi:hypothetical protein